MTRLAAQALRRQARSRSSLRLPSFNFKPSAWPEALLASARVLQGSPSCSQNITCVSAQGSTIHSLPLIAVSTDCTLPFSKTKSFSSAALVLHKSLGSTLTAIAVPTRHKDLPASFRGPHSPSGAYHSPSLPFHGQTVPPHTTLHPPLPSQVAIPRKWHHCILISSSRSVRSSVSVHTRPPSLRSMLDSLPASRSSTIPFCSAAGLPCLAPRHALPARLV